MAEYPKTEQLSDEKSGSIKSENKKQKKSATQEEEESNEKQGIPGANKKKSHKELFTESTPH